MEKTYRKLFEVGVEDGSIVLVENWRKHSIPPYILLDAINYIIVFPPHVHKTAIDWCKIAANCANKKDGKIDDEFYIELVNRLEYDFGIGKYLID